MVGILVFGGFLILIGIATSIQIPSLSLPPISVPSFNSAPVECEYLGELSSMETGAQRVGKVTEFVFVSTLYTTNNKTIITQKSVYLGNENREITLDAELDFGSYNYSLSNCGNGNFYELYRH